MVSAGVAALVSAVVSAAVAITVVVLRHWLTRRQEDTRRRAERFAEFSAAAWAATLELGRIALAETAMTDDLADELDVSAADRFNSALAVIRLLDPQAVYMSAIEVDQSLSDLLGEARGSRWTRRDWKELRRARLAPTLETFERVAREDLDAAPVRHIPWASADS